MTLRYSRFVERDVVPDAVPEAEAHVRAHLSAVADPDDDPDTRAGEVVISHEESDEGVLVVGELDGEPVAPYLRPDFTPEQDIEANPLSVEPIGEQP